MTERPDVVCLHTLTIDCHLGVYPHEQLTTQPVVVDVRLSFSIREAARSERLRHTVDYSRLAGEVRFLLTHGRFRLVETAAEAVAAWILKPARGLYATVDAVCVRLAKPRALQGQAVPSIEIERTRKDFEYIEEKKPFGHVDVVFETTRGGIYLLRVAPGLSILTHEHRVMEEAELVLSEGLTVQGKATKPGEGRVWPKHWPHVWHNPTEVEQHLLCIDRPRFAQSDEIEVEVPLENLGDVKVERFF
jgi:dihydroneopterin aldolase